MKTYNTKSGTNGNSTQREYLLKSLRDVRLAYPRNFDLMVLSGQIMTHTLQEWVSQFSALPAPAKLRTINDVTWDELTTQQKLATKMHDAYINSEVFHSVCRERNLMVYHTFRQAFESNFARGTEQCARQGIYDPNEVRRIVANNVTLPYNTSFWWEFPNIMARYGQSKITLCLEQPTFEAKDIARRQFQEHSVKFPKTFMQENDYQQKQLHLSLKTISAHLDSSVSLKFINLFRPFNLNASAQMTPLMENILPGIHQHYRLPLKLATDSIPNKVRASTVHDPPHMLFGDLLNSVYGATNKTTIDKLIIEFTTMAFRPTTSTNIRADFLDPVLMAAATLQHHFDVKQELVFNNLPGIPESVVPQASHAKFGAVHFWYSRVIDIVSTFNTTVTVNPPQCWKNFPTDDWKIPMLHFQKPISSEKAHLLLVDLLHSIDKHLTNFQTRQQDYISNAKSLGITVSSPTNNKKRGSPPSGPIGKKTKTDTKQSGEKLPNPPAGYMGGFCFNRIDPKRKDCGSDCKRPHFSVSGLSNACIEAACRDPNYAKYLISLKNGGSVPQNEDESASLATGTEVPRPNNCFRYFFLHDCQNAACRFASTHTNANKLSNGPSFPAYDAFLQGRRTSQGRSSHGRGGRGSGKGGRGGGGRSRGRGGRGSDRAQPTARVCPSMLQNNGNCQRGATCPLNHNRSDYNNEVQRRSTTPCNRRDCGGPPACKFKHDTATTSTTGMAALALPAPATVPTTRTSTLTSAAQTLSLVYNAQGQPVGARSTNGQLFSLTQMS